MGRRISLIARRAQGLALAAGGLLARGLRGHARARFGSVVFLLGVLALVTAVLVVLRPDLIRPSAPVD